MIPTRIKEIRNRVAGVQDRAECTNTATTNFAEGPQVTAELTMIADLTMTPTQAKLWEAAKALYELRWPQAQARIRAMTVPTLKQYARTTGVSMRGLTVRAHFEDVVKQGLMRQCADDVGFTAARGYPVGRPFRWDV